MDVAPWVTAVDQLATRSDGLYWPVWSLNLYTAATTGSLGSGISLNDSLDELRIPSVALSVCIGFMVPAHETEKIRIRKNDMYEINLFII